MPPDEPPFEVEFYRDPDGDKPVARWLRTIRASNPDLAERCKAALRKLTYEQAYHRPPHTKQVGDGLLEVRILGSDGARILFFYAGERRVIVVHAFMKKSRKLPDEDRNVALRAMQRWRRDQGQPRGTGGRSDR
jgi:phage-related protein